MRWAELPRRIASLRRGDERKAQQLGMADTHYVEPTGLSSRNQSSARDLATLVKAAHEHPIIRELSTSPEYQVGGRPAQSAVPQHQRSGEQPGLGYRPAEDGLYHRGRPLPGDAGQMAGRQLIMVFLDSAGKYSRLGDAERVRRWVLKSPWVPATPANPHFAAVATEPKLTS